MVLGILDIKMMNSIELFAKKVITYLIRRCFGQYLQTFTHEELSLDYNKGKAVVENVALKVEALNSLIDSYNLPFEVLRGSIDAVSIEVPWKAPFKDSSIIEFSDVSLVVQPKKCAEDGASMFSSMFESMASSQQMAEDCLMFKFESEADIGPPAESVETITRAIETIFQKMKIKFVNTFIQIQSILEDGITTVALEIKIKSANLFDEAGMETVSSANKNNNSERNSAYSIKQCIIEGISLYTAQYPASSQDSNQEYSTTVLSPGSPEMPPQHASLLTQKEEKVLQIKPVLISRIPGQQQLRLKLKQVDGVVGPKVDIEISLGAFNLFLSPYQVFMLIELANGWTKRGEAANDDCNKSSPPNTNRPMTDTDFVLIGKQLVRQHEKPLNLPSQALENNHQGEATNDCCNTYSLPNTNRPMTDTDFALIGKQLVGQHEKQLNLSSQALPNNQQGEAANDCCNTYSLLNTNRPMTDIDFALIGKQLVGQHEKQLNLSSQALPNNQQGKAANADCNTYSPPTTNRPMTDTDFALIGKQLVGQHEKQLNLPSQALENNQQGEAANNDCNTYSPPTTNRPMTDTDFALIGKQLVGQHEKQLNLPSQALENNQQDESANDDCSKSSSPNTNRPMTDTDFALIGKQLVGQHEKQLNLPSQALENNQQGEAANDDCNTYSPSNTNRPMTDTDLALIGKQLVGQHEKQLNLSSQALPNNQQGEAANDCCNTYSLPNTNRTMTDTDFALIGKQLVGQHEKQLNLSSQALPNNQQGEVANEDCNTYSLPMTDTDFALIGKQVVGQHEKQLNLPLQALENNQQGEAANDDCNTYSPSNTNRPMTDTDLALIGKQLVGQHEKQLNLPSQALQNNQQGNVAKDSYNMYSPPTTNRPMSDTDYALIQQELSRQHEKLNAPSQALQNNQRGWSSHSLDESDEEFHLMKVENKTTEVPLIAEDLDSSCSSLNSEKLMTVYSTGSDSSSCRKPQKSRVSNVQAMLTDPLTESTQIHLSCNTFSIVLLHDHRWTEEPTTADSAANFGNNSLNFTSLEIIAKKYFEDLATLSMEGLNFKDFDAIRDKVSKLTKANHLRFVASGVTVEVNEKTSSLQKIFMTSLTLLDLEILECLFNESDSNPSKEPSHMQIVSFKHDHLQSNNAISGQEACLKVKYNKQDYGLQCRSLKQTANAPNKLIFHMAPISLDIDISLANRIQCLLNPDLTFIRRNKKQEPFVFNWKDENTVTSYSPPKTEVQFSSSFVLCNLRFPVPDLRPYIDRLPWWEQNLRKESLVMELIDASMSFILDSEQSHQKIELQCRDFHGLFQLSPNERISFLRVSADPEAEKSVHDVGFDWPRLEIRKVPQINVLSMGTAVYQEPDETYFASIHQEAALQSLMANMKKDPSPFSSSSVAFGSKLPNSSPSKESNVSHDEIIKPAEKEKMASFIEEIVDRSQYVFDFCLPRVNIVLPDKNFFELLYNRLSSDLILWESTLMLPLGTHDGNSPLSPVFDLNLQPLKDNASLMSFKSCSDSNSEEEEDLCTYHSVQGHSLKRSEMQRDSVDNHKLTKLSIIMSILKGSITIHCPHVDASSNISSTCGRMQLCVEDSRFFIASSYKGMPNESYICFLANKGHLYHDSAISISSENPIVPPFVSRNANSSNLIIYPSESGVPGKPGVKIGEGRESIDVLSIAVHAVTNPKQQIKTFKMAIGVCGSTLRHHMAPMTELWLNQFSDFVNVTDYPILGYKSPSVVVELHVHLMNCAIDYRPLYLPLKTFSIFESFSLSTNITASTNSSLLRIISEELCLFLSNDMKTHPVNLKKGYVCVLDTGLIDLSVRVTSIEGSPEPKFEMCASNNMINIHTCADSCQALQKLIVYLACYGDFSSGASSPSENLDIMKLVEQEETETPNNKSPPVPKSVTSLMAEAMKDCSTVKFSDIKEHSDSELNDSDESFCIIEDDVGVGVLPKDREPQIRVLTTEPIIVVDDYFKAPSGKSDLLKAPKKFPEPVLCQTLREMSITWHLYGGNDFPVVKKPEKKRVRYNSFPESKEGNLNQKQDETQNVRVDPTRVTVSFCKVTPLTKDFNISAVHYSMEQISLDPRVQNIEAKPWILRGGEGRDHGVLMEFQMNKVKYQHDEYPKNSEYVSRDVLLIHDIEVRDKLVDSDFNKFLYQYSNESMPRQTHADMVVVKACRSRPDPKQQSEECSLKVSCKPLRLNVDQDALMFLYEFFKVFFEEANDVQSKVPEHGEKSPESQAQRSVPMEEQQPPKSPVATFPSQGNMDSSPTFFRSFSFSPDVLIRFDYKGKRVDLEQGALQGLIMGFGQLNCSEIKLKRLSYRHGLLGWDKLLTYAFNEWSQDIKRNQLPSLLGGVGPMHSVVQLFQGVKDFVWFPVAQYRKDGQIVRGLQRGASSFSTSTAAAVLELTSQFVGLIQGAAVYAYDMVSPGPSVAYKLQGNVNELRRPSQPADIREGMASAYNVMREGLGDTARTIVRVAAVEHEHKGVRGAVGGVLRQLPPAAVKPIILGTEAACIMLGGAKHQLVPDSHKEAMDKWRTRNN